MREVRPAKKRSRFDEVSCLLTARRCHRPRGNLGILVPRQRQLTNITRRRSKGKHKPDRKMRERTLNEGFRPRWGRLKSFDFANCRASSLRPTNFSQRLRKTRTVAP